MEFNALLRTRKTASALSVMYGAACTAATMRILLEMICLQFDNSYNFLSFHEFLS